MLDSIEISVLVLAADLTVVFANAAFLRLCDCDAQSVLGELWTEVLDVNESARRSIRATARLPEAARSRFRARLGTKTERVRWVEIDLRDDPRDTERQMFFLYDVTDIHTHRDELVQQKGEQMIGHSPAMQTLFNQIEQVAQGDWMVLLEGETGVGKELVARAIHDTSTRRDNEFIAVHFAGITDSLLGSQLFGHAKGAFAGAYAARRRVFKAAAGG